MSNDPLEAVPHQHEWQLSLEHGYLECQTCWSLMPPPGKDWNMKDKPLEAVPVEPRCRATAVVEAELLALRAERDRLIDNRDGWTILATGAQNRAEAAERQLSEVRDFVVRCYHIRGGSPNAFYQHVDAFCRAFPIHEEQP